MIVSELIEALQDVDPNLMVVFEEWPEGTPADAHHCAVEASYSVDEVITRFSFLVLQSKETQ